MVAIHISVGIERLLTNGTMVGIGPFLSGSLDLYARDIFQIGG